MQFSDNSMDQEQPNPEISNLKSALISMISHELRTPLTTILLSANLIERYYYRWSDEKKLKHIAKIQQAAVELSDSLNQVESLETLRELATKFLDLSR